MQEDGITYCKEPENMLRWVSAARKSLLDTAVEARRETQGINTDNLYCDNRIKKNNIFFVLQEESDSIGFCKRDQKLCGWLL